MNQTESQTVNFFSQELREQEYADRDELLFDDCSQESVDVESYDP
jgi:hypothetical protein